MAEKENPHPKNPQPSPTAQSLGPHLPTLLVPAGAASKGRCSQGASTPWGQGITR